MGEMKRRIQAIRTDRIHGASFLARESLKTLALAVEAGADTEALREIATELANARPAMAAVKNMVRRFVWDMEGRTHLELEQLCQDLIEHLDAASSQAAIRAASLIAQGSALLTCSFSSAVVGAIKSAAESGKRFRVLAVELEEGAHSYGREVLKQVASPGIDGELVPAAEIPGAVQRASMVLVGADKALPDGSLVNGAPSLEVAQAAKGLTPFFSICEAYKLDEDPALEKGFELVPPELISAYITEEAILTPDQIAHLFRQQTLRIPR